MCFTKGFLFFLSFDDTFQINDTKKTSNGIKAMSANKKITM